MGLSKRLKMYREKENLCLKKNDFQENAISAFGTLREDREFADVTLACEDGQQVEAHKVILASSSPFFQNLLRKNKHPHPLIYMRGLNSEDLVAMIDFLYYGEANVYQENLDSFLAVAEELQLKGLIGSGAEEEAEEIKNKPKKAAQQSNYSKEESKDHDNSVVKVETSLHQDGTVAVTDYTVAADLQDLDDKIKSMMEDTGKTVYSGNKNRKMFLCKVCGKEGDVTNTKDHIEAHHITGVSHTCNICGTTSRSRHAMAQHTRMNHTSGAEAKDTENKPKKSYSKAARQSIYYKGKSIGHNNSVAKVETSPHQEGTVAVTDYTVAADLKYLDKKIKSMMMVNENHALGGSGRARICKVCCKEGGMKDIKEHIESHHITGVSHICDICGTNAKSRHTLSLHKSKFHATK